MESAYSKVQKSRGMEEAHFGHRTVRVYPNVIEVWNLADVTVDKYTPEQWAALVQFVGIRGLEMA